MDSRFGGLLIESVTGQQDPKIKLVKRTAFWASAERSSRTWVALGLVVENGAPENLIQQVKRGLGNSSIFSLTTNAEVVSLQVNLD